MKRPLPDENSFATIDNPFFNEMVELVELLMYPLPRRIPIHFTEIEWELFEVWKKLCHTYMIDHEYRYIYFDHENAYDNQEPWEDEIDEIRRARENANRWIDDAKTQMQKMFSSLFSVVADRDAYDKHYPYPNESDQQMQLRSRKDAILSHEFNLEVQDFLLTKLIESYWLVIISNKDSVFIVDTVKFTGFSDAVSCTKLVCKINSTSNISHFYPIHDNELYKYRKGYSNPMNSKEIFYLDIDERNELWTNDEIDNYIIISD